VNKLVLILAAFLVLSTPAWSQISGMGINLYGGAGITVPSGDIADVWKNGFHGMVAAGYHPTPSIELDGRFARHQLPLEDQFQGDDFTISEYGVDVRANLAIPTSTLRPYAVVGAGFAKFAFTPSTLTGSTMPVSGLEEGTQFFWAIGGGLKAPLAPKINLFIELRYTTLTTNADNLNYFPILAGLNVGL